jgi:hypothetical protein
MVRRRVTKKKCQCQQLFLPEVQRKWVGYQNFIFQRCEVGEGGTYFAVYHKRQVHEYCIILCDGKVMHHDSLRQGNRNWVLHNTIFGDNTVYAMWGFVNLVSKSEHLTCTGDQFPS